MKHFGLILALVLIVSTAVSAEILQPAKTMDPGKWAFLVAGGLTKASNVTAQNRYDYGLKAEVGLIPNLDLQLNVQATSINDLAGVTGLSATGTKYGAGLKYLFITEGAASPVSLAGIAGYQSASLTSGGATVSTLSDIGAGLIVDKQMAINQILYGGVGYHSYNDTTVSTTATGIEGDLGYIFAFSLNWAVLGELNYLSVNPSAGAQYNNTSYILGVAYTL